MPLVPVPRTRTSSTSTGRCGMVKPNSSWYLREARGEWALQTPGHGLVGSGWGSWCQDWGDGARGRGAKMAVGIMAPESGHWDKDHGTMVRVTVPGRGL